MIDLHTHTVESDGSYTPLQLVQEAVTIGLEALAITDHDTLAGCDLAAAEARSVGLDLVCGIELSTRFRGKSAHLLGYFLDQPPSQEFRDWLLAMQRSRQDRNRRMAERLQSLGVEITLADVEAKGRGMTGRPHFALALVEKGYVGSIQEAFDRYLGESAPSYVARRDPSLAEAIERVRAAGGLPSIAHPIRMGHSEALDDRLGEMREMGLGAIEVYHSDHAPKNVELYLALARRYGLAVTGGSDFHGDAKPHVHLGTGARGNLNIPRAVLDRLREG